MTAQKKNGITMIALVVIIVLLLILVAVTLAEVNAKGLFSKATLAAKRYEKEEAEEKKYTKKMRSKLDINLKSPFKVGDYFEFPVGYTDVQTKVDIPANKAWKILKPGRKKENGNIEGVEIISTTVPIHLDINYNTISDRYDKYFNGKDWDEWLKMNFPWKIDTHTEAYDFTDYVPDLTAGLRKNFINTIPVPMKDVENLEKQKNFNTYISYIRIGNQKEGKMDLRKTFKIGTGKEDLVEEITVLDLPTLIHMLNLPIVYNGVIDKENHDSKMYQLFFYEGLEEYGYTENNHYSTYLLATAIRSENYEDYSLDSYQYRTVRGPNWTIAVVDGHEILSNMASQAGIRIILKLKPDIFNPDGTIKVK